MALAADQRRAGELKRTLQSWAFPVAADERSRCEGNAEWWCSRNGSTQKCRCWRERRLIPRRRSGRSMWLRARSISRARHLMGAAPHLSSGRPDYRAGNAPRASDISWRRGIGGPTLRLVEFCFLAQERIERAEMEAGKFAPVRRTELIPRPRDGPRALEYRHDAEGPLILRRLTTLDEARALHPSCAAWVVPHRS